MNTPADNPRAGKWLWVLALLPAILVAGYILLNARFVFIDDPSGLAKADWRAKDLLDTTGSGRYLPAFYLLQWAVFNLLPREPWGLTAVDGLLLIFTCATWFRLLNSCGHRYAGLMTAWLIALNASAAAVYFHMSTPEILLSAAWALAFSLFISLWLRPEAVNGVKLIAFAAACALTMLAKENGAFIALCAGFLLLDIARRKPWRNGHPRESGTALAAALVCALAAALVIRHLLYGFGPDSYATRVVFAERTAAAGALPFFDKTLLLPATLLLALPVGLVLAFRTQGKLRRLAIALLIELAALCVFFGRMGRLPLYYFQPAVPFAGALLLIAVDRGAARLTRRGALTAKSIGAGFVLLHGWQCGLLLSALAAWNWHCGQMTARVILERPARVWFYRTGYWEYAAQATLMWQARYHLATTAKILETKDGNFPTDLQAGDLVLIGYQSEDNRRFPAANLALGLIGEGDEPPPELAALKLELIADWRTHYPGFSELPALNAPAHATWKIYRLQGAAPD